MQLLETEWNIFRNAVIPKNAPQVQLTEMRRAFFAGSWAIYALMMNRLDPEKEPTGADLEFMAKLDKEMRHFNDRVTKEHA